MKVNKKIVIGSIVGIFIVFMAVFGYNQYANGRHMQEVNAAAANKVAQYTETLNKRMVTNDATRQDRLDSISNVDDFILMIFNDKKSMYDANGQDLGYQSLHDQATAYQTSVIEWFKTDYANRLNAAKQVDQNTQNIDELNTVIANLNSLMTDFENEHEKIYKNEQDYLDMKHNIEAAQKIYNDRLAAVNEQNAAAATTAAAVTVAVSAASSDTSSDNSGSYDGSSNVSYKDYSDNSSSYDDSQNYNSDSGYDPTYTMHVVDGDGNEHVGQVSDSQLNDWAHYYFGDGYGHE